MSLLYGVCSEGDINDVLDAIKEGANDWNWGLRGACEGGHMNIINLMIEKGANDWNWGLCGACRGGHMNIINLMIEKGATNIRGMYSYPKKHNNIISLLELGTSINKLLDIDGIDILVNNLKQFKETTYNELYQYMPKELANIVSTYCLL